MSDTMSLLEALRDCNCPRPANSEPDDLTVGQCYDKLQCGCQNGVALAAALRAPEAADAGAVADFAKDLAAKQEPLGAEFSQVLHDNLDELYLRSPTAAGIAAPQDTREALSADLEKVQCELDAAELRIKELEAVAPPAASADAVLSAIKAELIQSGVTTKDQSVVYASITEVMHAVKRALTAPVAGADAGMRAGE